MEIGSAMKKEDSTAKVLFDLKKRLEDFPIVKCVLGEKILCVQRQHLIKLIAPLALRIIVLLSILFPFVFISSAMQLTLPFALNNSILTAYIIFTVLSAFFVIEIFSFMTWYYHFYVITNKAIVHRHCFRIGGPYSEEVYGDKMHIQDVTRSSSNVIYDYLKIQDIYIYFHEIERKEPFILKAPSDAQAIEDLLDLLQSNGTKEKLKTNAI